MLLISFSASVSSFFSLGLRYYDTRRWLIAEQTDAGPFYGMNVDGDGNSFYVRSDQDIHDLAVEIATLTRTQQRGRGLRMA